MDWGHKASYMKGGKMLGLFKSKDLAAKEARVTEIGKMLFQQIS